MIVTTGGRCRCWSVICCTRRSEGGVRTLFKFTGLITLYFIMLMPTAFLLVLAVTLLQV
jgi:hypothetical protein